MGGQRERGRLVASRLTMARSLRARTAIREVVIAMAIFLSKSIIKVKKEVIVKCSYGCGYDM